MIELFRSNRSLQLLALNYGSVRPHQGSAARMQTLASCLTIPMKQVGNWVGNGWGEKYKEQLEQSLAQDKWRKRSPLLANLMRIAFRAFAHRRAPKSLRAVPTAVTRNRGW
jgi:hypothetical protein